MVLIRITRLLTVSICVALLLVAAGCKDQTDSASSAKKATAIGQPAPDFTLNAADGRSITLSSLRGKVVLVNFWASWCPPCRQEMPSMEELYGNYAPDGLELLAINVEADGPQIMPEFLRDNPHTFPVLFDVDQVVSKRYGVFQFPETFIVDRDGIIVDKVIGAIDWTSPHVLSEINRYLRVSQ